VYFLTNISQRMRSVYREQKQEDITAFITE